MPVLIRRGFLLFLLSSAVERGVRMVQVYYGNVGLDHEKLTYRYSGRDFRLTDVEGVVVKDIIA